MKLGKYFILTDVTCKSEIKDREMNRNEKMAKFIVEMRKAKGLTQKELAEQLGVTDKAVSKWERAASSPDIELLIPLARILEVSTGELLSGERDTALTEDNADDLVNQALEYSHRSIFKQTEKMQRMIFWVISFLFFIADFVCLICDYAISGKLSWSLIVLTSLAAAWIVILPFLRAKEHKVRKGLMLGSILIFPYLEILCRLLGVSLIRTMGMCIAAASVAGLWCVYGAACKWRQRKYFAICVICCIVIGEEYLIRHIVDSFIKGASYRPFTLFHDMLFLLLLIPCFGLGVYFRNKKNP